MRSINTPISLAFLLMLFIMACLTGTSISADKTAGKEEVKKEVKQQKNPYEKAEITARIIPSGMIFSYE